MSIAIAKSGANRDGTRLSEITVVLSKEEGELILPNDVAGILDEIAVYTAEDLLSCIVAFPTILTCRLDCSSRELERFHRLLINRLRGIVPDFMLQPPPPELFPHGAIWD